MQKMTLEVRIGNRKGGPTESKLAYGRSEEDVLEDVLAGLFADVSCCLNAVP